MVDEGVLELENRRKLYKYILKKPGSYLREIEREFGMQVGVLEYHLKYLEKKEIQSQYKFKTKVINYLSFSFFITVW